MSNNQLGTKRSDLLQLIEEMLSAKLGKSRPELILYAINENASITAKLYNLKQFTNYNFDYVAEAVQNIGNAEAISKFDLTSQLLIAINQEGLKMLKQQKEGSTDKDDSESGKTKIVKNPEDLDVEQDEQEVKD